MKVVNVRSNACTHYIGRGTSPQNGAINAQLGNPFMIGLGVTSLKDSREDVCAKFEELARKDPIIKQRIKALPKNAVLGCWCKPLACHGDVIVKLWEEWQS